jgi:hypothetical protein
MWASKLGSIFHSKKHIKLHGIITCPLKYRKQIHLIYLTPALPIRHLFFVYPINYFQFFFFSNGVWTQVLVLASALPLEPCSQSILLLVISQIGCHASAQSQLWFKILLPISPAHLGLQTRHYAQLNCWDGNLLTFCLSVLEPWFFQSLIPK